MALRRGVKLLLEHALVYRRDGPLRAAVDLAAERASAAERMLGNRPTDATRDPLGALSALLRISLRTLAPFAGSIGITHRHPHDRDREVSAGERRDARDVTAGADDHRAAYLLAQNPVRRANVLSALRRDRRRLERQAGCSYRRCGLVHDRIARAPPALQREVKALDREIQPEHLGVEHAQRLFKELLTGLVAFEHDNSQRLAHRPPLLPACSHICGEGYLRMQTPLPGGSFAARQL